MISKFKAVIWFLQVVKSGIVESRPNKGSTVVIRASGKLDDGKEVDVHEKLMFTVGDGEVRLNANFFCLRCTDLSREWPSLETSCRKLLLKCWFIYWIIADSAQNLPFFLVTRYIDLMSIFQVIIGLDMIVPLMDKGEIADVYVASRQVNFFFFVCLCRSCIVLSGGRPTCVSCPVFSWCTLQYSHWRPIFFSFFLHPLNSRQCNFKSFPFLCPFFLPSSSCPLSFLSTFVTFPFMADYVVFALQLLGFWNLGKRLLH